MTTSLDRPDAGTDSGVRIAMWSGPRNISTALMRAWGSRPDTAVWDEPLYAHYLKVTGREHPGRDEVVAHHETDVETVVHRITDAPIPGNRAIFYQKHMAHHMLPDMSTDWVLDLRNAFLIRDPGEMLSSLSAFLPDPSLRDTGLEQQWTLYQQIKEATGRTPPVVDARDVLLDPEGMLRSLCDALEVPFRSAMLSWEAGPRETDGVWAKHWYDAVEASTGFQPYSPTSDPVPRRLRSLHGTCQEYYRKLSAHRLSTDTTDEADS